ncbi:MAG: hypothetical protein ACRDN0_19590 [Trebonia sp.]
MADLAELHEELGCLLGFTLATGQLARRATALTAQETEGDLVQVLQRLDEAGEQVQRQCQLLIARHAGLRAGRVTATSRKVRAGIVSRCSDGATLREVLELLTITLDHARATTVNLAARNSPDDEAVADFTEFVLSIWKNAPLPSPEAVPSPVGHCLRDPESAENLVVAAAPAPGTVCEQPD